MPEWVQWVTFAVAVLGAVLGIFNATISYRRGVRHVKVTAEFDGFDDPQRTKAILWIEVINAGHVPIVVRKMFLAGRRPAAAQIEFPENSARHVKFPVRLDPGATIRWASSAGTFDEPFMQHAYGAGAELTDGKICVSKSTAVARNAAKVKAALQTAKRAPMQ